MKVVFVEQHSMKLGGATFANLSGRKFDYLAAVEAWPYIGMFGAVFFFIGYALRAPMSSKLYRESCFSVGLGMFFGSAYPLYYRSVYINLVDEVYHQLKRRFEANPHLAIIDDENSINKNFGISKWADSGVEDEGDVDVLNENDNIFERNGKETDILRKKLTNMVLD